MPFTNSEIVRRHLVETISLRDSYRDVAVEMSGLATVALMHSQLKEGSLVVKGKELGAPRATLVTLGDSPSPLGYTNLIPDSVVVASDTSLGHIYTEHVDYHIDYVQGTILRLDGEIPTGATVAVWFFAYRVYHRNSDYAVDHGRGTVRRISGSQIEDGQTVFVDYETQSLTLDEGQLDNAVAEADDLLLSLIDESYHDSSNQGLVTAETYLALAVLCRVKAMSALQQPGGTATANHWQELGANYRADGLKIAQRFAPARRQLNSPVRVEGGDSR